ncbi:unnamed protein product [Ophioblennius macclurei]
MEEMDTAAILQADQQDDDVTEEDKDKEEKQVGTGGSCCGSRCRFGLGVVTVEPVLLLSTFSMWLQLPLSAQYLWERVSAELGFNGTRRAACGNASLTPDPLEKQVEILTAKWNLYLSLAGFSLGLLTVPLLGSWSDRAGRRPLLVFTNVGVALQTALYLLVMYLELPVAYLLLGKALGGATGDFTAILAGCFSYVADVSRPESRTFRVAVLEACLGISGMVASVIGGKWLQVQGYINPFWLVLATSLGAALYTYLFLPESVQVDPDATLWTTQHHRAVWRLYRTGGGGAAGALAERHHVAKLWLYTLCFFLVVGVHVGCKSVSVLYLLSSPLCWGPDLVGIGAAVQNLSFLTSLLGLKVLRRCLQESWVALVGLLSNVAGQVVLSIAATTPLVFTGYGLNIFSTMVTPVIRSKLSRLVDPSEQGTLFAAVACVESVCFLVGGAVFNSLYAVTLDFMKGFAFLFAAIVLLVPAAIMAVLQCLDQRRSHSDAAAAS